MNQILAELKTVYGLYAPLWDEWTLYRQCGLSDDEIFVMNIHIRNKFQISIEESIMFYNKPQTIESLTIKLKFGHKAFRAWVIEQFVASLLFKGLKDRSKSFFSIPISDLGISSELKQRLVKLNVTKLDEVLALSRNNLLTRKLKFESILACQEILVKEEKTY